MKKYLFSLALVLTISLFVLSHAYTQEFASRDLASGLARTSLFGNYDYEQIASVINEDDRQIIKNPKLDEYPFSAIGKLKSDTGGCTASLIGPYLILTNRHCVGKNARFYPGYSEASFFDDGTAVIQWFADSTNIDWAIGLLNDDLGNKRGILHIANVNEYYGPSLYKYEYILAGYSGDIKGGQVMTSHVGCYFSSWGRIEVTHCCDMTRGASGSPILAYLSDSNKWVIVALNNAETRKGSVSPIGVDCDSHPNYAVSAQAFYSTITNLGDGVDYEQAKAKAIRWNERVYEKLIYKCNNEGRKYKYPARTVFVSENYMQAKAQERFRNSVDIPPEDHPDHQRFLALAIKKAPKRGYVHLTQDKGWGSEERSNSNLYTNLSIPEKFALYKRGIKPYLLKPMLSGDNCDAVEEISDIQRDLEYSGYQYDGSYPSYNPSSNSDSDWIVPNEVINDFYR